MRAAADKVAIQSPFDQPRSYAVAAIERFSACGSMVLTIFASFSLYERKRSTLNNKSTAA
jgi:hypothetical protein